MFLQFLLSGKYFENFNWNAFSAITQAVAALITLGAIFVSLHLARLPMKSLAKIKTTSHTTLFNPTAVKLINTGLSPIYIKSYGVLHRKSFRLRSKKSIFIS